MNIKVVEYIMNQESCRITSNIYIFLSIYNTILIIFIHEACIPILIHY